MIYDVFPFLNEFDLLEIRLRELSNVVDRFVICEGDLTFTGNPKPFHLDEQWERFAPWHDRITRHHIALPSHSNKFHRDHFHKNAMMDGLPIQANDVVIWSDVDEIPRASVVRGFNLADGIRSLGMTMYRFFFNVRAGDEDCIEWPRAKILSGDYAKRTTFQRERDAGGWAIIQPIIHDAGWHFSSCGGTAMLKYKLDSFAHSGEPHNDRMAREVGDGSWIHGGGFGYGLKSLGTGLHSIVEIDETYPAFVQENVDLMRRWGMIYDGPAR